MSDNSLQKKIQPDAQQLFELLQARMPFGKYAGRRLIDIPEEYLIWLERKGFPAGKLGRQLTEVLEIKVNGLGPFVRDLVRRI